MELTETRYEDFHLLVPMFSKMIFCFRLSLLESVSNLQPSSNYQEPMSKRFRELTRLLLS